MRLSDAMKPAVDWSEAAMLPARLRPFTGGAALGQLKRVSRMDTAVIRDTEPPAPAPQEKRTELRRAAYRQVRRLG